MNADRLILGHPYVYNDGEKKDDLLFVGCTKIKSSSTRVYAFRKIDKRECGLGLSDEEVDRFISDEFGKVKN